MTTLEPIIKKEWQHFFETVHVEEDWITPLLNAVEGIRAEEAFWRPGGEVASIADVVMHLTGHFEATLRALMGMPDQDYEDWPAVPPPNQENWTRVVERLRLTAADLSRALHNLSLAELYGVPAGKQSKRSTMLTNIFVHNAYHAGQIVKLKQAFAVRREAALA